MSTIVGFFCNWTRARRTKILKEIILSYNEKCISLDKLSISEILPVIKNCNCCCNDSSFSHFSASLGLPTIVLM